MVNKELLKGWKTGGRIGKGSFGVVYEISRDYDGITEKSALKVIEMPKNEEELLEYQTMYTEDELPLFFETQKNDVVKEFETMQKFSNDKHIVSFFEHTVLDKADGTGWTAVARMELLTPLTTYYTENALTEEDVIRIGIDICSGLETLNKAGVVHRDIKYQNVFIDKDHNFKLGDFGTARSLDHTTMATKKGTIGFMAPEVYNNEPCNQTLDYYSVGLLLYWLLNERRLPFLPLPPAVPTVSQNESAVSRRMAGEVLNRPKYGSDKLTAVIMKATSFNPKNRYASATEMKKDLLSALERGGLDSVVLDIAGAKVKNNYSFMPAESNSGIRTEDNTMDSYRTESVFSVKDKDDDISETTIEETLSVFGSKKSEPKKSFFSSIFGGREKQETENARNRETGNVFVNSDELPDVVTPVEDIKQNVSDVEDASNYTDETVSVFSSSRNSEMMKRNAPISNDVYWGISNSNLLTLSSRELLEREKTVASGMLMNQGLEWQDYAEDIMRVVVKDPIQPIGHIQFMSFENCREMDLTFLNTEKITDMSYMFDGCSSLEKLDLTGFDTSKVTDMNDMFSECTELRELLISSFDTSSAENMDGMFYQCSSLKKLDLRNFDTGNVEYMNRMFNGCKKLEYLDVSSFDTSNVTDMGYMFSECYALKELDLSGFDISNVDDHIGMFYGTTLTVENTGLNTEN